MVTIVVLSLALVVLALADRSPTTRPTPAGPDLSLCADPAAAAGKRVTVLPEGLAEDTISGARVVKGFTLSRGYFTAAPPRPGYRPRITEAQAACQLSSGYGPRGDGVSPGQLALAVVTVSPPRGTMPSADDLEYQQRVAWILVSSALDTAQSCPAEPQSSATPAPAPSYAPPPLEIFAIDAATGGHAFVFEDAFAPCGGLFHAPGQAYSTDQTVSVPWSLVSRAPDGLTAVITASWPACDQQVGGSEIRTDRDLRTVTVMVSRPFGPDCAGAVAHTLAVRSDLTGKPMAATLVHGAIGVMTSQ